MRDQLQINTEIIDIDKLKPNPNNPRTVTKQAMERLKNQIVRLGQYKPIIIDTRTGLIVGGHMRYEALKLLGVQKVFVSYITSENDNEAMEYSLSDNDRAGYYDADMLANMMPNYQIDWSMYAVDFKNPTILSNLLIEESQYTAKIQAPIYEPQNEKPALTELYSTEKTKKLLQEIDSANIEESEKEFLRLAASRHTLFTYSKIADYYAHASEDMKRLMENSALVIIDYKRAVENGFIKMATDIINLEGEEYGE